jgi:hypothetical protein
MRRALVVIVLVALVSCARLTAPVVEAPLPGSGAPATVAHGRARAERIAVAMISRSPGEIERTLGAALAAELDAVEVDAAGDAQRARALAGRAGAARLVTCEVVEHAVYDPMRLTVRLSRADVADAGLSARDVERLTRSAFAPRAAAPRETERAECVTVDAGAEPTLIEYALRHLGDSFGADQYLLEAEILLRDPARFVPFAAAQIARSALFSLAR